MNANVANMEHQRLAEPEAARELDDDETLAAVRLLMNRNPRYRDAMNELINDFLILKGESLAITLGITFPPEEL